MDKYKFERINKYLVVKWDDIDKYLPDTWKKSLQTICEKIDEWRHMEGRGDNKYVVVNEDEPYAEAVWKLIEAEEISKHA